MSEPAANARVVVYRTASCPFCVMAVQLLESKGIPLEQVHLDDHPDHRGHVESIKPGHRTVPLIVIDGEALGGFDDLRALDARGGLDALA